MNHRNGMTEEERQIKTTDWLIRGIPKEQLEREKKQAIMSADLELCHTEVNMHGEIYTDYDVMAQKMIDTGYRKQSEGEWIDKPTGIYGRWQSWCSACGEHSGIGGIESNRHKPYCPNCGAHMKNAQNTNEK